MMKRALLLVLVAAFGMGAVMAVYAADEPKNAMGDQKNTKTLQGTLVDLQSYLDARAAGKDPTEAAKAWTMTGKTGAAGERFSGGMGGSTTMPSALGAGSTTMPSGEGKTSGMFMGNTGSSMGEGARVKGFLVTEKDWLTKMTPGRELYVVVIQPQAGMTAGGNGGAAGRTGERSGGLPSGEKGNGYTAGGGAGAMNMSLDTQVGTKVKLTGQIFDEDGVRAISITKIEPVSGTAGGTGGGTGTPTMTP